MNPSNNAPVAPTGIVATAGVSSASVAFVAVSGATYYTVTSTPGNIVGYGTSSPIVVSGLTNGTSYTFIVRAVNATGTSPASAASAAVKPAAKNDMLRLLFLIFLVLVLAGALNWGLVAALDFDLVRWLGNMIVKEQNDKPSVPSIIIYGLVGLSFVVVTALLVANNKDILNNN